MAVLLIINQFQDNVCDGVYFAPWDSGWSDKWHMSSLDKQEVCITMATKSLKVPEHIIYFPVTLYVFLKKNGVFLARLYIYI